MKKENCNQNVKVEKMVVFIKTFDYYRHKFNFGSFFSCPVKNLKLKFRSKFNHGYLNSVICKGLYDFNATDNGSFFRGCYGLVGLKRPPSLKYILHILQQWHLAEDPKYTYIYINKYIYINI